METAASSDGADQARTGTHPHGRTATRAARAALVLLAGLLVTAFLYRAQLLSRGGIAFLDAYDGTIELAILEHWFAVLRGQEAWHTTGYFHPYGGTLAYNDGYFLLGVAYSLPRSLGANVYVSAELAHAAMWLTGFLGLYAFLRAAFAVAPAWALLAAATFTLSSTYTTHSLHSQLSTVCLVPVFGWMLARLASNAMAARGGPALGWGVAAATLLGAWLLTALYMAWFTLFFALLLLPAWLLAATREERRAAWRIVRVLGPVRIAALGVAFVLAVAPFVWLYLPKSAETGMHPFAAAFGYLPRPTDVLNVGGDNLLFGGLMTRLHAAWPKKFVAYGERLGGLSPPLLLAFLAACAWCWLAAPFRGRGLVRALCLASVVAWLLALDYGHLQPWRWIYAAVPGAKAVRVVARIQLFLAVPVIAAVGVAFAHAARRLPAWGTALAAAVLLLGQPATTGPLFDTTRLRLQDAASVPQAPAGCTAFFTREPQDRPERQPHEYDGLYSHNVDAMLIAGLIGLPTINGFSTFNPPGWNFAHPGQPSYTGRVWTYAQERGLTGLCALNLRSMTWDAEPFRTWGGTPEAGIPLGETVSVAAGQPGTSLLGAGWSAPEDWGVWSDGPLATLVLRLPPEKPVTLTVSANALPRRQSPTRAVAVLVGGAVVGTWIIGPEQATFSVTLPPSPGPALVVRLRIEDPVSPIQMGLGEDPRRLGVALRSVRLDPAP